MQVPFMYKKHAFWCYLLAVTSFIACQENDIEQVDVLVNDEELPVIMLDSASITYTDSGKLKARIKAGRVENYLYFDEKSKKETEEKLVMTHGVKGWFYDKQERLTSTLSAEKATRYDQERVTHIENDVRVVNSMGDSLTTEYLIWDENTNMIRSDQPVRVARQATNEIIFADGFESDVNFEEIRFKGVTGTISLD